MLWIEAKGHASWYGKRFPETFGILTSVKGFPPEDWYN
jgi:hypothetical protein